MTAAAEPASGPTTAPTSRGALRKLDRLLGIAIAVPTATLVLVEVFVLLGGVISRYVFHHPIIWSDELASTLFLWLAMLGSAMALHRSEHMRMTAFVGMLSPPVRLALDVVATFAGLAFLVMILPSAYDFAADEIAVTTPDGPRAARLEFDAAVATADDVRQVLVAMVKRARAALH